MKIEAISDLLLGRIDAGDFPSAVYLVAQNGAVVAHDAVGRAVVVPEEIDAQPDTDLLPDFAAADKNEITVGELLTHTSRLTAWLPLYLCADSPDDIVAEIADSAMLTDANSVTYSDLNYIALGRLIERVTGRTLDDAAIEMIFEPLSLNRTFFCPPSFYLRSTAASECGNGFERQTCERDFPQLPIKPNVLRSEMTETLILWVVSQVTQACFRRRTMSFRSHTSFCPNFQSSFRLRPAAFFNAISRRVPMSIDPSDFSLRQRRSRPRA